MLSAHSHTPSSSVRKVSELPELSLNGAGMNNPMRLTMRLQPFSRILQHFFPAAWA